MMIRAYSDELRDEFNLQDPRVLDKMMPYQIAYHGNPHSRTHMYGWETEKAVEHARKVSTLNYRLHFIIAYKESSFYKELFCMLTANCRSDRSREQGSDIYIWCNGMQ